MEAQTKTFAVIENGIVKNAIVVDDIVIAQALLPGATLVQITEQTGSAFIDGAYNNGVFISPKPYASWVLDEETNTWEAPVEPPQLDGGSYLVWNEDTLEWGIFEIPLEEMNR